MILPFDELNLLQEKYSMPFLDEKSIEKKEVIDDIEDLLVLAYVYGVSNINESLGVALETDPDEARKVIFDKIDGLSFEERISGYFDASVDDGKGGLKVDISGQMTDLLDAIKRIAESETTRVFNESMLRNAEKAEEGESRNGSPEGWRSVTKTWMTVGDDKVRNSHQFLDGTTIKRTEKFWTYDGDEALAPGGFSKAQNNVNCRCWCEYGWSMG